MERGSALLSAAPSSRASWPPALKGEKRSEKNQNVGRLVVVGRQFIANTVVEPQLLHRLEGKARGLRLPVCLQRPLVAWLGATIPTPHTVHEGSGHSRWARYLGLNARSCFSHRPLTRTG